MLLEPQAYLPTEIIAQKRDDARLSKKQVEAFVSGLTDGSWSDAQVAAMAMAIALRGMSVAERTDLTLAMARSGQVVTWDTYDLPGPIMDKHSTGGVGDKVSLIVGALVAAAGGFMPKMSGRGLGHTGGTVDKLEAIPGYETQPDPLRFRDTVRRAGFALIGQSGDLAPADKRLYAIRDVTATVPSIDLISSSIMSKKLALSPQCLVLDVKVGSGSFMSDLTQAKDLGHAMVQIGKQAGVKTCAVLTDMNQVLGTSVGNALEVQEAVEALTGVRQDERLLDVSLTLAATLVRLANLAVPGVFANDAEAWMRSLLDTGAAAERFELMVSGLGGPNDFLKRSKVHMNLDQLHAKPYWAPRSGYWHLDPVSVFGYALVELGGGRRQPGQKVDPLVGFVLQKMPGHWVDVGEPLVKIWARSHSDFERACDRLAKASHFMDRVPEQTDLILGQV